MLRALVGGLLILAAQADPREKGEGALTKVPLSSVPAKDLATATDYRRPAGLEIQIVGAAVDRPRNVIAARCRVENRTSSPLPLVLQFPQGFLVQIVSNTVTPVPGGPRLPETFPWPRQFEIPPMSSVEWDRELSLGDYTWAGAPTVELALSFLVWNEANGRGVEKTVSVQLPQRSP